MIGKECRVGHTPPPTPTPLLSITTYSVQVEKLCFPFSESFFCFCADRVFTGDEVTFFPVDESFKTETTVFVSSADNDWLKQHYPTCRLCLLDNTQCAQHLPEATTLPPTYNQHLLEATPHNFHAVLINHYSSNFNPPLNWLIRSRCGEGGARDWYRWIQSYLNWTYKLQWSWTS